MKISLYTITLNGGYYDGPPVPLLEIFPKAKAWGYDGIEIEAKRPHGSPLDLDAAARKRIAKAAADNGLEISCIGSYNDFSSPIDEHRENELLMVREQIALAADLAAPVVRVFAVWSGVTRRDGRITYDVARRNIDDRWPGTTPLEKWCHVRDCLAEAAGMAERAGVTLALQNHRPIITGYQDMLDFIAEVGSPALKACLDAPLMSDHSERHYRAALEATGDLMVHTHFGGRFVEDGDGKVDLLTAPGTGPRADYPTFMKLAREIVGFEGHTGYELCSPVLTAHRHEGLDYALRQAELACRYMREIIDSL
ncbi:MAG: sugar phosphate isomerase/epimerase family protein [Planctomycetota bacterium]|jgi:sugar phosphate isomerase/epimerase